jgi:hypothetical protein
LNIYCPIRTNNIYIKLKSLLTFLKVFSFTQHKQWHEPFLRVFQAFPGRVSVVFQMGKIPVHNNILNNFKETLKSHQVNIYIWKWHNSIENYRADYNWVSNTWGHPVLDGILHKSEWGHCHSHCTNFVYQREFSETLKF